MGIIFVAGMYGVGKSTLCEKLSQKLNIPFYSAGDLISKKNGERYGANKAVADKEKNQNILVEEVENLLTLHPQIILAGHFCIFNKANIVEQIPEEVFFNLHIEKILLLEADEAIVQSNLRKRDNRKYSITELAALKAAEQDTAFSIARKLSCKLFIHNMMFADSDSESCMSLLG